MNSRNASTKAETNSTKIAALFLKGEGADMYNPIRNFNIPRRSESSNFLHPYEEIILNVDRCHVDSTNPEEEIPLMPEEVARGDELYITANMVETFTVPSAISSEIA
ncbi:hypothetical protein ACTXT7_016943 [Hymenolepis weldensis]